MNKIRILFFLSSIIFFGFLFINNLNEIDFAKTKNDAEFYRKPIAQIENSENIEELKTLVIQQTEYLKKNRDINSKNATIRNWLIIGILLLNIGLFFIPNKNNK